MFRRADRESKRIVEAEQREATRSKTALVFDGEERLRPVEYVVKSVVPEEGTLRSAAPSRVALARARGRCAR